MQKLIGALATLLCAAVIFAADVTGKWTGTVETPNGTRDVTMNLKADGSALTGTVSGRNGDTEIKDGKINGDDISFTVIRNFNGNEIKQNYTGKVSGNTIKFKYQMRDREIELTVKRATS